MRPMIWVGIVLIVLGVLVFAYQGIKYTRQKGRSSEFPFSNIGRASIARRGRLDRDRGERQVIARTKDRASGVSPSGHKRSEAYDRNRGSQAERRLSMILLIILLVLLFGGGGGYYGYSRWGSRGGMGIVGTVLIIVLVVYLVGGLR